MRKSTRQTLHFRLNDIDRDTAGVNSLQAWSRTWNQMSNLSLTKCCDQVLHLEGINLLIYTLIRESGIVGLLKSSLFHIL